MSNASRPRSALWILGTVVVLAWAVAIPARSEEIDHFAVSKAAFELSGPFGTARTVLSGPVTVNVTIGTAGESADTDADGKDQVPTEMVELHLTGSSPIGAITVEVRDASKHPFMRTLGEIEETSNSVTGRLDLPPFAPSGTASSFFDVFFEITIDPPDGPPIVLHNHVPKHMEMTLQHKPPGPGEFYENPQTIDLFTEEEEAAGVQIVAARHVPDPELIAAGCVAKLLSSPPGVDVTLRDSGTGLVSAEVTSQENLVVNIPSFPLGSKGPVLITARKQDPALRTRFELKVLDVSGNVTVCDPIMTLQVRENGQPVSETFGQIPQAERLVTVLNGRPGLKNLHVAVNGTKFVVSGLKDGEERTLDIASALAPGNANVVVLTPQGKPGGSADVAIHD